MPARAVLLASFALFVVALIAAPGGRSAATLQPTPAVPPLVFVRDSDLVIRDADGTERSLLRAADGEFLGFPVWSPGGERIALVREQIITTSLDDGWGSQVEVLDVATGATRTVWTRDASGVQVIGLAWADGGALLLGVQRFTATGTTPFTISRRLERLDLVTGALTPLVEDALLPSIARDGSRIAYLIEDAPGTAAVWVAAADGSDARLVLPPLPDLIFLYHPRIAPDGRSIVFAAARDEPLPTLTPTATPTASPPPPSTPTPTGTPAPGALAAWPRPPMKAHGLPMHLWQVSVETGALTRLTGEPQDDPAPAWTADGAALIFLAVSGLYHLDPRTGATRQVAEGAGIPYLDARWSPATPTPAR